MNEFILNHVSQIRFEKGQVALHQLELEGGGIKWYVCHSRGGFSSACIGYKDKFKYVSRIESLNNYLMSYEEALDLVEKNIRWHTEPLSKEDLKELCDRFVKAQRNELDKKDCKEIYGLILKGETKEALDKFEKLDTFVRDGMPERLYMEINKNDY